jgi:outer membrane protein assembly factor BamB
MVVLWSVVSVEMAAAQVTQLGKLVSLAPGVQQYFGTSVAIDGNWAVAGEPLGITGGNATGAAYLFPVDGVGSPRLLRAADAGQVDVFGSSVAIAGNLVVVGAPGNDDACPLDLNCDSGSAYLFNAATGQQLRKLTASNAQGSESFGASVAVSGQFALVGSGSQLYVFDVATGQELRTLQGPQSAGSNYWGRWMDVDGTTAVVGQADIGAAYLFDVSTGERLFDLSVPNLPAAESFGGRVAIDGQFALVGSVDATHIFDVSTGELLGELPLSGNMMLDGEFVVLTEPLSLPNTVYKNGVAHLFNVRTREKIAEFSAVGALAADSFGGASPSFAGSPTVGISGGKIIVGAPTADSTFIGPEFGRGAAYLFEFQPVPEPGALVHLFAAAVFLVRWSRVRVVEAR